jgi:hypothetical protein
MLRVPDATLQILVEGHSNSGQNTRIRQGTGMEATRLNEPQQDEIEELDRGNPEQLVSLQRLFFELPVKNRRLRMELISRRVESSTDKGSPSLFE